MVAACETKREYARCASGLEDARENGYEATEGIRGLGRKDLEEIPIVAMSANAFADDIQQSLDSGMNDHVTKPVEVEKLSAALDK